MRGTALLAGECPAASRATVWHRHYPTLAEHRSSPCSTNRRVPGAVLGVLRAEVARCESPSRRESDWERQFPAARNEASRDETQSLLPPLTVRRTSGEEAQPRPKHSRSATPSCRARRPG